ncbi:MAG TPA: hypothetical protein VIV11_05100 [Kofleriaceae bacterium]
MSSRDDHDDASRRRLWVPGALAVAFIASSAAVGAWYGGCTDETDPPVDAGLIEARSDANVDSADADPGDTDPAEPPSDAALPPDSPDH